MNIGIVGAGVLGLSLGHYLQKRGHQVDLYDRNPYLGGLACSFDYGEFIWDKFYHLSLAQDTHLLELLEDIGLGKDLRWRPTGIGHYADGSFYALSSPRDLLRFSLLTWSDKIRMGLAMLYTVKVAQPGPLYKLTAREWLIRTFGPSNYTNFWEPLLRAKFGEYAETVAAVFIWASVKRLFGVRSPIAKKHTTGYVHGGYHHILETLRCKLESRGSHFYLGAQIHSIAMRQSPGRECGIEFSDGTHQRETHWFDKVIFTGPKQFALPIVSEQVRASIDREDEEDAGPTRYQGVVCLVLILRRSLTPYYVLSIADDTNPLTGVIEMTNLINADEETKGLSLIYLPRYLDSNDVFLRAEDAVVFEELFEKGLKRLFPDLAAHDVVSWHVQRASHVQPLPLVRATAPPKGNRVPRTDREFILANSSLLRCATLNNNEIVGLAKEVAQMI
ncbi:MAG TPA: FAD-dependent oxidoreductase [Methylomirabilota bacterium]|nr:FAD-dependent oxidoreductase [Methylomirabilota bacterium]